MSKAFTKDDGAEEAPIPRRRAPLPEGTPNYVTPRGLQALREELAHFDATATAAPSVQEAQGRAAWREELERRIATAIVVVATGDRKEVRFGATVRVRSAEGRFRDVQLVGVDEADGHGRISFRSPLARVLLGQNVSDTVTLRRPGGDEPLEIIAVAYDEA